MSHRIRTTRVVAEEAMYRPIGQPASPPPSPMLDYAMFYSVVPSATTAVGAAMGFPSAGPAKAGTGITAVTTGTTPAFSTTVTLAAIGFYEVNFVCNVAAGAVQVQLSLNGTPLPYAVVGGATGTTERVFSTLVQTLTANSTIQVLNPAGNAVVITNPPPDGNETIQQAATLTIKRLA